MGIRDRPTSARAPWQNGYAETLIGSIGRECLDRVVVFGKRHLRNLLRCYQNYYNECWTHPPPGKDAPQPRAVQVRGAIAVNPVLGGGPDPEKGEPPSRTLPDLCRFVEARFNKTLVPQSVSRVLRRRGLSRQKARPLHPRRDEKPPPHDVKRASQPKLTGDVEIAPCGDHEARLQA